MSRSFRSNIWCMEEIHPCIPWGTEREQTLAVLPWILSNSLCTQGKLEGMGSPGAHGTASHPAATGMGTSALGHRDLRWEGKLYREKKDFFFFFLFKLRAELSRNCSQPPAHSVCAFMLYGCQTVGKKCGWKESSGAYWLLVKQTVSGIIFNHFCVLRVIKNMPFCALLDIQSRILLHSAAEARFKKMFRYLIPSKINTC